MKDLYIWMTFILGLVLFGMFMIALVGYFYELDDWGDSKQNDKFKE